MLKLLKKTTKVTILLGFIALCFVIFKTDFDKTPSLAELEAITPPKKQRPPLASCSKFNPYGVSTYSFSEYINLSDLDSKTESLNYSGNLELSALGKKLYFARFTLVNRSLASGLYSYNISSKLKKMSNSGSFFKVNDDASIKSFKADSNDIEVQLFWKRLLERINFSVTRSTNSESSWQKDIFYAGERLKAFYKYSSCQYKKSAKHGNDIRLDSNYAINSNGFLAYLDISEKLESKLISYSIRSQSSLAIEYLKHRPFNINEKESLLSRLPLDFMSFSSTKLLEKDIFQRELGNYSLNEIFDIFSENMDADDKSSAYFKLLSWISLNPNSLDLIEAELIENPLNHVKVAIFSSALKNSNISKAQDSLKKIISFYADKNPAYSSTLLNDLALFESPSKANETYFRELYKKSDNIQIKSQAYYSLGTFADKFNAASLKASNEVVQTMLKDLKGARNVDEETLFIGALGNSKSSLALPAIKHKLTASDEFLRAESYLALRGIEGENVDNILVSALNTESEYTVVKRVLSALYDRNSPKIMQSLSSFAKNSKNPQLRQQAYGIMFEKYQETNKDFILKNIDYALENETDENFLSLLERLKERFQN